jgi:hypothetical protein
VGTTVTTLPLVEEHGLSAAESLSAAVTLWFLVHDDKL